MNLHNRLQCESVQMIYVDILNVTESISVGMCFIFAIYSKCCIYVMYKKQTKKTLIKLRYRGEILSFPLLL